MTDDITSPSDLKNLSEKELWQIAVDDDHPGQLAAQSLLDDEDTESPPDSSKQQTSDRAGNDTASSAGERKLSEICDSLADDDSVSERMQEVAARIRDGIKAGEIDAE